MIEVHEDNVEEMVDDEFDADAFMIEYDVGDPDDICDVNEVDVDDVANIQKVVLET